MDEKYKTGVKSDSHSYYLKVHKKAQRIHAWDGFRNSGYFALLPGLIGKTLLRAFKLYISTMSIT